MAEEGKKRREVRVVIRDFIEGHGDEASFRRLNEWWLMTYGWGIEPKDAKIFEQAKDLIVKPGGRIFFLEEHEVGQADEDAHGEREAKESHDKPSARSGQPMGCCALLPLPDYTYKGEVYSTMELIKLGVDPSRHGCGYGRQLMNHAIEQARAMGVRRLYLESNKVLTPALRLYESSGFVHLEPERIPKSDYARADVYMEMYL